ncbi:hypothetical protein GH741_01955 [Aquibacillus halophilus]|uniref:HMA domain-containing protein n=1 Tax=Aquibacillus halophilus TaxID=930132 RepID=A0A6A8DA70_9BACI|nr:hypothetical protein [Aquibacillus halophilus]MRH41436.1 hypothetical protein [Aquibacillus halophilus]
MAEKTIYVREAVDGKPIQEIENILNQMNGIERVLIDTDDGEVKIEFDEEKVSTDQIISALKQHEFHL